MAHVHSAEIKADAGPAPGARETLVEIIGLGVRRAGRWPIRHVDLTLRRGEIVTCIGPNGGGKTTLARAVLGIVRADEGAVRRVPGLTVGYVPQRVQIDPTLPLTVRRLMTLTGPHPDANVTAALDEVGIGHLAARQAHTLSGGEFQRALLARAIVRAPDLLVLDEPVQGVDHAGEIALYELIGRIRDRTGCAVLMISHDLHIVMAASDQVICLNGHVCCSGGAEAVAGSPEYQALFGRRGAAALALYRHHHDHVHHDDAMPAPPGGETQA